MAIIGEAEIRIRGDTRDFEKETGGKIAGVFGGIAKVGTAAFAAVGVAATAFGAKAIGEATELAKVTAQTSAVLTSTGGAAGVTAEQVKSLSDALARTAGVEGEVVQAGANMLLTFTNIKNRVGEGNDVFDQSVAVLTDLATALGTDPQQAAIQLGKALNDPVQGISALRRVGVAFTEDQEKVIKSLVDTGDIAGAQKVILAELNKEFGGSAAAAGSALSPLERMNLIFKDIAESVGTTLIPVVNNLVPVIGQIFQALGPALGGVAQALVPAITALANILGPILAGAITTLAPVLGSLATSFAQILVALAPLLQPLTQIITLIGSTLARAITTVAPLIEEVAGFLADALGDAIDGVGEILPDVIAAFRQLFAAIAPLLPQIIEFGSNVLRLFLDAVLPLLPPLIDLSKNILLVLFKAIEPLLPIILDLATTVLKALFDIVTPILPILIELANIFISQLLPAILPILPPVLELASLLLKKLLPILTPIITVIAELAGTILTALMPLLRPLIQLLAGIAEVVSGVLNAALSFLIDKILKPALKVFEALIGFVKKVIDFIGDLARAISKIKLPDWLTPGSPTPLEIGLGGIAEALEKVSAQMREVGRLTRNFRIPSLQPAIAGAAAGPVAAAVPPAIPTQIVIPVQIGERKVETIVVDALTRQIKRGF